METRTWFEVLRALGTFGTGDAERGHPDVVSRTSPWLSCRFPNGTVTVAVHLQRHVEAWPGGFARNAEEDARIMAAHPLGSDRMELEGLKVAGHEVRYRGRLLVAFRKGNDGRLLAYGGYDCAGIWLDGMEYRFAAEPLGFLAFAPVVAERRVPGGAVMEIWVQAKGEVRVPLLPGTDKVRLFDAGRLPGHVAGEVASRVEDGRLVFEAASPAGRRHLYVVG